MQQSNTNIWIYAHWRGMKQPKLIGILSARQAKGRKAFSFEYTDHWLQSLEQVLLDPDIGWFRGQQYPNTKENFGIFFDSMPDTWGRTLMKRQAGKKLYDIDFLLGVHDECRMGGLRFKLHPEGPFLDNSSENPAPPLSNIRELQHAANLIEQEQEGDEHYKWLAMLMAPGSSLGGARPKANLRDEHGDLWIAKFPSAGDTTDKAAWEYLAHKLAKRAGITMADAYIKKVAGRYHTFFTKRFDRQSNERIHFASAMTMTGNSEDILKEKPGSYLEIAEFIQFAGGNIKADLAQLWKRIVFSIAISNTDDHMRNHGFILSPKGWILSPAYDINPSTDKNELALNIDTESSALDMQLAKSVGEYFQLTNNEMDQIIAEVKNIVKDWRSIARNIGIPASEQAIMAPAFETRL